MCDVPAPVNDAFEFYRRGFTQAPVSWSQKVWIDRLGERPIIAELPNPLSRECVASAFKKIGDDKEAAEDAFIAAMIWGFGRVGYGAWRTQRIIDANSDAALRLLEINTVTKNEGGPAGFEEMARQPLKYLGVAFGTKYLFFSAEASPERVPAAPVLDRIVRSWLAENLQMRLDIWSWKKPQDYQLYCERLGCWADARGLTPGQAEEAIFEYAVHGPRALEALPRRVSGVLEELARIIDQTPLDANARDRASEHLEQLGEILDDEE